MKNIYLVTILVLVIACLTYLVILSTNNINKNDKIITKTSSLLDIEQKRGMLRDFFLKLELKYNDSKIDEGLKLTDEKGKIFEIKEKLKAKRLVFRYSELHCNVCVEKQIESLKNYKDKIGIENILILADYSNYRNLILFKRLNSLDITVYSLSEKISIELEKKDIPYFFIVDSSLIAKDYFIPIKEIKNYTDNYLNIMYNKHFKNKKN